MGKIVDMTNRAFEYLRVIAYDGKDKHHIAMWKCECRCGKIFSARGINLRNGHTQSCGCLKTEASIRTHTIHNLCYSRLYDIWENMKTRCYNKNSNRYYCYGGRGIIVCEEWLASFRAFYDWAMSNGYSDELSIDRRNNNKGYSPDNCRWETSVHQARNKSRYRNNTSGQNGISYRNGKWAAIIGVDYKRINLGYFDNINDAIAARKAGELKYWNEDMAIR